MKRGATVIGMGAACALVVAVGCSDYDDDDRPVAPDAGTDGAPSGNDSGVASSVDGGAEASAPSCDRPAHDLSGCLCAPAGSVAPCYQGIPGAASGCKAAGSQSCYANATGELRWSQCVGGTVPAAKDTCFDEIDDDCNGIVDDGCACSTTFDLCTASDAGTDHRRLFTLPAALKMGKPFDLFYVTDRNDPDVDLVDNSECQAGPVSCASAGAGCKDWKVKRFHFQKGVAGGEHTFVVRPHQVGLPGCDGTPNLGQLKVIVEFADD